MTEVKFCRKLTEEERKQAYESSYLAALEEFKEVDEQFKQLRARRAILVRVLNALGEAIEIELPTEVPKIEWGVRLKYEEYGVKKNVRT